MSSLRRSFHQKEEERNILLEMLKYAYYKWSESNYFTEKEFVYMSNQTCLMYPITYQNTNNNTVLKLYSKILRKIRTLKSLSSVTRIHDHEMRGAKALH